MGTPMNPHVSVVMSVYNAEEYLAEAIEGILNQTYDTFEFIIINDGSTDKSLVVMKKFAAKDKRIRVVDQPNKGLVVSLNRGLKLARGKYVARQDADDISDKNRLEEQYRFLEANPEVGMLGSNYYVIDSFGNKLFHTDVFTHPEDLKLAEILFNQFGHGSVMLRKTTLDKTGGYRKCIAEDFDLWTRINRVAKIANLKEPLYMWRSAASGLSTDPQKVDRLRHDAYRIRDHEFAYYLSHRRKFRLISLHPFSTLGGPKKYFEQKNAVFKDLSLMYCYRDRRLKGIWFFALAILHAPWIKESYFQMFTAIFRPEKISDINYHFF